MNLVLEKRELQFRSFGISQRFTQFRDAKSCFVWIVRDNVAKMINVSRDYFSQDKTATARLLDGSGFYCSLDASCVHVQQYRHVIRRDLIA